MTIMFSGFLIVEKLHDWVIKHIFAWSYHGLGIKLRLVLWSLCDFWWRNGGEICLIVLEVTYNYVCQDDDAEELEGKESRGVRANLDSYVLYLSC